MPEQLSFALISILLIPSSASLRRFSRIRGRFAELYRHLQAFDASAYTVPHWNEFNARYEAIFLPRPSFKFLRDAQLRSQMFVDRRYLEHQLEPLKRQYGYRLPAMARESLVGMPRLMLMDRRHVTSPNTLHCLYHWMRFEQEVGPGISDFTNIVEWGGGYGNVGRLVANLNDAATYTIVDTPLMSCVQWLFLTSVFGEEKVSLWSEPNGVVEPGKINLIPVCFIEETRLDTQLFFSTWALDESSARSQELVIERDWFGAKHLLLATSQSPPSKGSDKARETNDEDIAAAAVASGATIVPIPFRARSRYVFR